MASFDFSLVSAPFRMQPGLRRVASGEAQLTASTPGGRHLREKVAVLGSFADQALLSTPAVDEPAMLRAVAAEAARSSPGTFLVTTTPDGATRRNPGCMRNGALTSEKSNEAMDVDGI